MEALNLKTPKYQISAIGGMDAFFEDKEKYIGQLIYDASILSGNINKDEFLNAILYFCEGSRNSDDSITFYQVQLRKL